MTNDSLTEIEQPGKIILETICPFCSKKQQMVIEGDRIAAYKKGKTLRASGWKIQDAFYDFSPEEREFILSGICPKCWDDL